MWRLKPAVDFLGASMHASWHFGMFAREDFGVAYGFCCDLIRSVSAPAPWWVTELQAGPTVFTGSRPLNPTGAEITRWLWDGFGNGARGIVYWLWHPRTQGNEAGEWALAGPNGEDTERTRATKSVAEVLARHADFFNAAKPMRATSAILYPRDAMLLYAIDGWRRPTDELMHSLMGCYKACCRAHVAVDFLDVSELEAGKAAAYRVLYLPYAYALSEKSVQAIREFVRAGGVVWADGLVGWKDEQGATRQLPPGPLSDLFGFTLEDIQAEWDPFSLTDGQEKAGELWRCVIPRGTGGVLRRTPDGRALAVDHLFGRGRAIYYGTALTYAYLRRESRAAMEWIAGPAIEAAGDLPVRLTAGPGHVISRALQAGDGYAAVLNNWGARAEVTVRFPRGVEKVLDVLRERLVALRPDGQSMQGTYEMEAGTPAVLLGTITRSAAPQPA